MLVTEFSDKERLFGLLIIIDENADIQDDSVDSSSHTAHHLSQHFRTCLSVFNPRIT